MAWVYRPDHPLADANGMVEKHLAGEPVRARSTLPFPMVVTDQIEIKSMVDGQIYTSKAALRRSYREHGYVEVGNEWLRNEPQQPRPKSNRKAIRDSVGKALNRAGIQV